MIGYIGYPQKEKTKHGCDAFSSNASGTVTRRTRPKWNFKCRAFPTIPSSVHVNQTTCEAFSSVWRDEWRFCVFVLRTTSCPFPVRNILSSTATYWAYACKCLKWKCESTAALSHVDTQTISRVDYSFSLFYGMVLSCCSINIASALVQNARGRSSKIILSIMPTTKDIAKTWLSKRYFEHNDRLQQLNN